MGGGAMHDIGEGGESVVMVWVVVVVGGRGTTIDQHEGRHELRQGYMGSVVGGPTEFFCSWVAVRSTFCAREIGTSHNALPID